MKENKNTEKGEHLFHHSICQGCGMLSRSSVPRSGIFSTWCTVPAVPLPPERCEDDFPFSMFYSPLWKVKLPWAGAMRMDVAEKLNLSGFLWICDIPTSSRAPWKQDMVKTRTLLQKLKRRGPAPCRQVPHRSYRRQQSSVLRHGLPAAARCRNKARRVPPRSRADRSLQGLSRALQRAAHD